MDISVNTSNSTLQAMALQAAQGHSVTPKADLPPVVSPDAVKISDSLSNDFLDIGKLIAQLREETDTAQRNSLLGTIQSAYDIVTAMNLQLAASDAKILAAMDETAKNIISQEDAVHTAETTRDQANAALKEAEDQLNKARDIISGNPGKIADLNSQIDQIKQKAAPEKEAYDTALKNEQDAQKALTDMKNAGPAEGETEADFNNRVLAQENTVKDAQLATAQAKQDYDTKMAPAESLRNQIETLSREYDTAVTALPGLEQSLTEAQTVAAEKQQELDQATTALNELTATYDQLADSLNDDVYRALIDAARELAGEIGGYTPPEEEQEKDASVDVPQDRRNPMDIFLDSLRRQEGDFLNTVETRREQTV